MKADGNQLRARYATLSDEDLLATEPADLTPRALKLYQAEMGRRGLPRHTSEDDSGASQSKAETARSSGVSIPIAEYRHVADANMAKSLLMIAGVPCSLSTEYGITTHFNSDLGGQSVCLMAPEELVESARLKLHQAEMKRSGLSRQTAEDSSDARPSGISVPIAEYRHVADANMAKSLLMVAGIPCSLSTEYGLATRESYFGGASICLMAPEEWVERAKEVLESRISEEELAAQAEAAGRAEPDSEDK